MLQVKHENLPDAKVKRTSSAKKKSGKGGRRRIRCPKCGWEPQKKDLWSCTCHYTWNTFDTAALCPGCGKQWEHTACLRCHQWSPHKDWYEKTPDET